MCEWKVDEIPNKMKITIGILLLCFLIFLWYLINRL